MGQSTYFGFEGLSSNQKQRVLDFMWLCAQAGDAAADASLRSLQALLAEGESGPDDLDEFLRQANAELRRTIASPQRRGALPR